MIPTNSGSTSPCSNISSNCVVWQGPDLPCINLCHGDSITEVISKLAEELCELIDAPSTEPDLKGLDLKCVLPDGTEAPTKISDVLQLIVDYVCNIVPGDRPGELPQINVAACLRPGKGTDDPEPDTLRLDLYAQLLGTRICEILASIAVIQTTLNDHEQRLIVLENCFLENGTCSPGGGGDAINIISQCINAGQSMTVTAIVQSIETKLCNLEDAVGSPSLIGLAINQSCITGSTGMLSSGATYGSSGSWTNNPSTLAQSHNNLWAIVCDMYSAIESIQTTCCSSGCDGVTFAYTVTLNLDPSGNASSISFNFGGCNIPPAFNDCNGFTNISITDGVGGTETTTVNISNAQNGIPVTVPLGSLNKFQGFTTQVAFCATDGANQCSDTISQTLSSPSNCPSNIGVSDVGEDTATVAFTNNLGSTATYTIDVLTASVPQTLAYSTTVNNPGTVVQETIPGLAPDTLYVVKVSTTLNGLTTNCTDVFFTTQEGTAEPFCNQYEVTGQAGQISFFSYVDCDGNPQQEQISNPDPEQVPVFVVCAQSYSPAGGITVTNIGICPAD